MKVKRKKRRMVGMKEERKWLNKRERVCKMVGRLERGKVYWIHEKFNKTKLHRIVISV